MKVRTETSDVVEEEIPLEQNEWMDCAQSIPKTKSQDKITQLVDKNFDWESVKIKYTQEELDRMPNWIISQKEQDQSENLEPIDDVDINKLNKYQKFTYDIVKLFKTSKEQLFIILLGICDNIRINYLR